MAAIDHLQPIIHRNISVNSNYNPKDLYTYRLFCNRFMVLHQNPNRFASNSVSFRPVNLYRKTRISKSPEGFDHWGGFLRNQGWRESRIRANSSSEQDSDSNGKKSEAKGGESKGKSSPSSNSSPSSPSPRGKQGKGGWWKGWKWRWQPIIQAHEVGIVLLQLGIVIFVMRLLRPGIPLPGSEPMIPTTLVSVPYSEFLSKINTNKVQKVEVDGVHIMFRLKSQPCSLESEGGSSSKLQDSELLLRSAAPTELIVYTTTRPNDIKTPYEKMLENDVEFGSPDKRSGGFLNSALDVRLEFVRVLEASCCARSGTYRIKLEAMDDGKLEIYLVEVCLPPWRNSNVFGNIIFTGNAS